MTKPSSDLVRMLDDADVSPRDRDTVLEFAASIRGMAPAGTSRERLDAVARRRHPDADQPVSPVTETAELCGICGADHDGQCPGTEPPAPYVDTRPRYPYRLPDGRVVQVIHDHGEAPRPTIICDFGDGDIAEGALLAEYATNPAPRVCAEWRAAGQKARRTGALLALLSAWSDAAAAGALPHASLQIFGEAAADALETWAASRGVAVERDTLAPAAALSSGVTEWPIVSVSLPGGGTVTAHRGLWI